MTSERFVLTRDFEAGADRFERAVSANAILVGLGVEAPSVEDVAKIMRWADGYAQSGLDNLHASGWRKEAGL